MLTLLKRLALGVLLLSAASCTKKHGNGGPMPPHGLACAIEESRRACHNRFVAEVPSTLSEALLESLETNEAARREVLERVRGLAPDRIGLAVEGAPHVLGNVTRLGSRNGLAAAPAGSDA